MGERPIVLVDMDDTINHFSQMFWQVYNMTYDENVDFTMVNSWNLQDFGRADVNVYDLLRHPGLFRNLSLKTYAVEFIENLQRQFMVYIVTDSPQGTSHQEGGNKNFANPADDKRQWMREHFPSFPQDQIIICSHKWMIEGDVLVDDKPDTFLEYTARGKKCILIDMPYNRHIDTKWRAKDLIEAEQLIHELFVPEAIE